MNTQGFLIKLHGENAAAIVLPDTTTVHATPEALMAYLDCEGDFKYWHSNGEEPLDPYNPNYTILSYYKGDNLIVEDSDKFKAMLTVYGVYPSKKRLGDKILYEDIAEFFLASKSYWRLTLKDHRKPHGLMVIRRDLRMFDQLIVDKDKSLYVRQEKGDWEEYVALYFDPSKTAYIPRAALKNASIYLIFRGNPRERKWETFQDRCFSDQQTLRDYIEDHGLKWADAKYVNHHEERWFWQRFLPSPFAE